jgi:hypothetical protein
MNLRKSLIILFAFSYFLTSICHAEKSIILTDKIITSLESCPTNSAKAKMLNCKAYLQTTSFTCGPASIMTLLNYYGKLPSSEMNKNTELKIAHEMGAANSGTNSSQMIAWLTNHGFKVRSGYQVTTNLLISMINQRIPVIVAYDNHWLVADGYVLGKNSDEDEIHFADSCCKVTTMSRDIIDSMTLLSKMKTTKCKNLGTYIVATPY